MRAALLDRDTLGRASVSTALGAGAGRAAGLAAALGTAAVLSPAEFGRFTYLTTTAALLGTLGSLGFGPLVTRTVAAGPQTDEARQIATAVLLVSATLPVLGGGLVAVAGVLPGPAVPAVLIWALGSACGTVVLAVLAGHRRFTAIVVLTVTRSVASGGAVLVTGTITAGATTAALAAGLTETVFAAVAVLHAVRCGCLARCTGRLPRRRVAALIGQAASSGVAALAIQGAVWLVQSTLLLRPDGPAENGAFGLACRLSLIGTFLPSTLAAAAVPYLGRQSDPVAARALARRVLRWGLGPTALIPILLAAVSPLLNPAFGPAYAGYAATTALMAVAGLATSANVLLGSVAVGLGGIRSWVLSDLLLAAVLAAGAVALVPALGAPGAAVSHLLAYACSAGYLLLRLRSAGETT